jgi:hypothetical protein
MGRWVLRLKASFFKGIIVIFYNLSSSTIEVLHGVVSKSLINSNKVKFSNIVVYE